MKQKTDPSTGMAPLKQAVGAAELIGSFFKKESAMLSAEQPLCMGMVISRLDMNLNMLLDVGTRTCHILNGDKCALQGPTPEDCFTTF